MNDALISELKARFSEMSDQLRQLLMRPMPDRRIIRLEQSVPVMNLKGWLSHQNGVKRSYWRDRAGDIEIAGLGVCWSRKLYHRDDIVPACQYVDALLSELPEDTPAQCFSYLSFSDEASQVWPSFGYGLLLLPVLECVENRRGATLAINLNAESKQTLHKSINQALQIIAGLCFQQKPDNHTFRLQGPVYSPDRQQWQTLMDQAQAAFKQQAPDKLNKVVLSREAVYGIFGNLSPWYLLQYWQQANPHSYSFLIEGDNSDCFFGCSPEKLIQRQGRIITTEALAGTTRRGRNRDEDFQLEVLLMNDRKNIHENHLVLDDIRHKLGVLCRSLETDRSHSVVKLNTIQHLRYQIRGVLNDSISDGVLMNVLHPTPAVGGSPRNKACHFIDQQEPYSRGLYAGACGVLGRYRSELCVSIRSARLTAHHLTLFAGAGIVSDSNSQDEWQELNNKIATVCDILERLQTTADRQENSIGSLCIGQV